MNARALLHSHWPVYRVVRAGWGDPLDASFSQQAPDRRWNTADFPALYCCCSVRVAKAVARDLLGFGGVVPGDLAPSHRPRLLEIQWQGRVADVISSEGVTTAGFPPSYPVGVDKLVTRACASRWFTLGLEGVVCRSASLARFGTLEWTGSHEPWGELAIFTSQCAEKPRLVGERDAPEWLGAYT